MMLGLFWTFDRNLSKTKNQNTMKKIFTKSVQILLFGLFSFVSATAQDTRYIVRGKVVVSENDTTQTPLDSILFENLTNGTRLLFNSLPDQTEYTINLSTQSIDNTTGIFNKKTGSSFSLICNIPGLLSIALTQPFVSSVTVSVYNVNGQKIYISTPMKASAGSIIKVSLPTGGMYFVKIKAESESKTYKAFGSLNSSKIQSQIIEGVVPKKEVLKSQMVTLETDFSFSVGDSLRVSVFKDEYYAKPLTFEIKSSQILSYIFKVSTASTTGISDAYVALNDTIQQELSYDPESGIVELTNLRDTTIIESGQIITIDADTTGYLRKVVSVTDDNSNVTLHTEQAYLNDIFVDTDFKLNTAFIEPTSALKSTSSTQSILNALTDDKGYIHPVKIIYYNKAGKQMTKSVFLKSLNTDTAKARVIDFHEDMSGTDIYKKGDNIHFFIEEGYTSFTADAVFEFDFDFDGELTEDTKIKKGNIKAFKFYLEGRAEFLNKYALDMNYSYEKEDTKKLIDMKKVRAKFIIPPGIPFWITFDVDIYGYYHLSADASLHANWGFESNHTLQVGGEYEKETDAFTPIAEYTPKNTIYPLNINGEVNAFARFEIYPRAEIKLYEIFGPYAEIVPFIEGNYNAALQSQITTTGSETFLAWNSGIDLGLDLIAGTELSIFGIFDWDSNPVVVNCFNFPLWKSPTDITLLTELPAKVSADTTITLDLKVADLLNLNVPLCPVYITGDGEFSKQMLITGENGEAHVDWTVGNNAGNNTFTVKLFNADNTEIASSDYSVYVIEPNIKTGTVTDIDGNTYKTVKIGDQWWMAENLKVTHYPDGTVIPQVTDNTGWVNLGENSTDDAYCFYNNNKSLGYGALYTYSAAINACPSGWHLPSDNEWKEMEIFLGMNESETNNTGFRGTNEGTKLKSEIGWNNNGYGTNDYGFSALPGGYRYYYDGSFRNVGDQGYWWTSTEYSKSLASSRFLNFDNTNIERNNRYKSFGFSIRCVKDNIDNNNSNLLTDLVSYWKLDGDLKDAYGSNDGTAAAGVTSLQDDGVINYAPYFNGNSNAYITCGNNQSLNITGKAITIAAWIKLGNKDHRCDILSKGRDYTSNYGYHMWVTKDPMRIIISYRLTNGKNNGIVSEALEHNKWYHIVSTFDGRYGKLYINGELVKTTDQEGSIGNATTQFTIGAHSAGPSGWGYQWKGNIDEVGIWKRVLSAEEVSKLYNNGNGLQYPF